MYQSDDDTRFRLGWMSALLLLGVAVILGYLGLAPILCGGVFFLGLGFVCVVLAYFVGDVEMVLVGFGVLLAVIGTAVIVTTFTQAALTLVLTGIIIAVALAGIISLLVTRRKT